MNLTATLDIEALSDGTPVYVSWCRELDIASQGETRQEAMSNLGEAVQLFLEHADDAEIGARFRRFLTTPEIIAMSTPALPVPPVGTIAQLAAAGGLAGYRAG